VFDSFATFETIDAGPCRVEITGKVGDRAVDLSADAELLEGQNTSVEVKVPQ